MDVRELTEEDIEKYVDVTTMAYIECVACSAQVEVEVCIQQDGSTNEAPQVLEEAKREGWQYVVCEEYEVDGYCCAPCTNGMLRDVSEAVGREEEPSGTEPE